MITAVCPHCKAKLGLKSHVSGASITCPKCKTPFTPMDDIEPLPDATPDVQVHEVFERMTSPEPVPPLPRRRRFLPRSDEPVVGWAWAAGSAFCALCALITTIGTIIISSLSVFSRSSDGVTVVILVLLAFGLSILGTLWGFISLLRENNALGVSAFLVNAVLALGTGGLSFLIFAASQIYRSAQ